MGGLDYPAACSFGVSLRRQKKGHREQLWGILLLIIIIIMRIITITTKTKRKPIITIIINHRAGPAGAGAGPAW